MITTELGWKTSDGIEIYAKEWRPEGELRAVICLVHGLGEHCNRYDHMAKYYGEHGIALIGYDRRGHGKSGGKRGHTISYDAFLDEIEHLTKLADTNFNGLPKLLYGHSMGGNLVLNFLLRRSQDFEMAVVSGPWIKLAFEPRPFMIFLGKISRKIAPGLTQPSGLDTKHISTDPVEVKKYEEDPLIHDKITSETGMSMMDSCDWLLNSPVNFDLPVLFMHGSEDQIISPEGTKEVHSKAKGDVELKIWPGLFHEIHNEVNRQDVFNYTLNWITSKLN